MYYCILLQLKKLHHLGNLTQLQNLNISKCANIKSIAELQNCSSLQSLNLSGLKLSPNAFSVLEGEQDYIDLYTMHSYIDEV